MKHAKAMDEDFAMEAVEGRDMTKPFGMLIGHSTMKNLIADFIVTGEQGFSFTGGPVLEVIPASEEHPEILHILLAFDQDEILDAAWLTADVGSYEALEADLAATMELINRNEPVRGNRSAAYRHPNGIIEMHSAIFSQEMTIGYSTDKFQKAKMEKSSQIYE